MPVPPHRPRALPRAVRAVTGRMALAAYLVLGVADSVLAACDVTGPRWVTKTLLMPLLILFLWRTARPGTRWPAFAAPAFGCLGDVGLLAGGDAGFLIGMAGFAAGHICYLTAFRGIGGRPSALVITGYGAALAAMTAVIAEGLGDLLVPVLLYSLLLTAVAVRAAGAGLVPGAGGALFLFSDAVIALGLADVDVVPGQDTAVMPTYLAAQLLLALTWTSRPVETAGRGPVVSTG